VYKEEHPPFPPKIGGRKLSPCRPQLTIRYIRTESFYLKKGKGTDFLPKGAALRSSTFISPVSLLGGTGKKLIHGFIMRGIPFPREPRRVKKSKRPQGEDPVTW